MRALSKPVSLLFFAVGASSAILWTQEPCAPPSPNLSPPGPNIFSEQQEEELGDIMAQRLTYHRVADDPAVSAYLARVGDGLVRYLPPNQFRFRYFVVDSAASDAFAAPGGRIYVSRGLVSQLRSPDEVAAILAHEMGHVVAHQGAQDATFLLERVLGVTQVTDRQDIQRKLDDLDTNWRRNPSAFRQVAHRSQQEQLLADQVGLYAMTAAGYSPEVYPALFDRIANTGGKLGDWLSDLLHTTTPEQLRLREMLKVVQAMPAACIAHQAGPDAADFRSWRMAVLDFTGWSKRIEDLHGVLAKVKLDPLTLGDVLYVRFSPDGKFLLAQKDQSLYIFTRDPFTFSLRIHAPDANQPRFTVDSKSVVFTSTGSRVEVWDLATQTRVRLDDLQLDSPCTIALPSPDARTLACLRRDGILDLIQLPSGDLIFRKKRFSEPTRNRYGFSLPAAHMEFSPDGGYFVTRGHSGAVVLDLTSRKEIHLPSELKYSLGRGFAFLSNDRLLAWPSAELHSDPVPTNPLLYESPLSLPLVMQPGIGSLNPRWEASPAALYELPSGKRIERIPMGWTFSVAAATHGEYLLIGPLPKYPLGIVDLNSKKIVRTLEQRAADVYGDVYAHQTLGGDLGLYDVRTGKLQKQAAFPSAEDAKVYWGAMASPELRWLAASAGAVWDLGRGKMVYHLRRFRGGSFEGEEAFYADFLAYRETPRTLARVGLAQRNVTPIRKIEEAQTSQYGPYLVVTKPQQQWGLQAALNPCRWKYPDFDPMDCDVTAEVHDALSGRMLWSRHFAKEFPRLSVEPRPGRVILRWEASAAAVADEIKNYPQLADAWAAARKHPGASFLEILNLSDGSVHRAMVLDSGAAVLTAGERLLVSHRGYMEVFSLATGEKEGEIAGSPRAISPSGDLLSVRGDASNELDIYDLQSRRRLDHFAFSADLDFDQFSADSKRLLVLSHDQTAYFLDMTALHPQRSTGP